MELFLTDTKTRKKRKFVAKEDKNVGMYVCGITPYDFAHIGHGRCYSNFDVLYRVLKFLNYDVTYVRNFTDIDDKILDKAKSSMEFNSFMDVSSKYIKEFTADMDKLNNLRPDYEPRVTENIEDIVTFIEGLIASGHAYISGGDVYFDVESFSSYGELSGENISDLNFGARVSVDEKKKNPADFALWKADDSATFWESPWGNGRLGWHIECSVLSKKYLGDTIDIHGGGMDLIFPHHENERAQSEALTNVRFVNYWVHNAFVNINNEKMSKST